MEFRFNFDRCLEASAYLLQQAGGSMEYIRLLKLLYIAERELLNEQAMPLTGDIYKAMKNGPVLSTTLDIIKDRHWRSTDWGKAIRTTGYHVALTTPPAFDHLAPIVVDKLREVHARYRDTDTWTLVESTK